MSSSLFQSGGGSGGSSLPTPVSLANGGTHADLSATGGANQVVKQTSLGGDFTVAALIAADIPNLDAAKITTGLAAIATSGKWSDLQSATTSLSLSNAGNATTFNQTSAVTWSWLNTTAATSSVSQSSPIIKIAGRYWTGAADAEDSWTIQNVVANGSNGLATLTITHAGSTGVSALSVPAGTLGTSAAYGLTFNGATTGLTASVNTIAIQSAATPELRFYAASTLRMQLAAIAAGDITLTVSTANTSAAIIGNTTTSVTRPAVSLGSSANYTGTGAGTQYCVAVGDISAQTSAKCNFSPTSGATNFVGLLVLPTINQTSTASGSYTGLLVNVIETALLGSSNKLLDLQSGATGGVSRLNVDNSGQITESTANGGTWVMGQASELLTLSTVGLTTDTAANLLPVDAIIEAVVCRVTTTITTTTNWAVGDGTTAARFRAANATLTAGTTSVGIDHWSGAVTTLAAGPSQAAAAKVRITCTGANPGAGVIRITVFYRKFVAPTS